MKRGVVFLGLFAVLAAGSARAAPPVLQAGVRIQDGGANVTVDTHAAPEVADWNNDGKKDLLVGQFTDGKVKLFLNQGSDASPSFNGGTFIQSGGGDLIVPDG